MFSKTAAASDLLWAQVTWRWSLSARVIPMSFMFLKLPLRRLAAEMLPLPIVRACFFLSRVRIAFRFFW